MGNWLGGSGEDQGYADFVAWEDEPLGLCEAAKEKRAQSEWKARTRRYGFWRSMVAYPLDCEGMELGRAMIDV